MRAARQLPQGPRWHNLLIMTHTHIHLFAMPASPADPFAKAVSDDAAFGALYRRQPGHKAFQLQDCLSLNGRAHPIKAVPRRLRKLSGKGILTGDYGFPRRNVPGYIDWSTNGYESFTRDNRMDEFVVTKDFIAHRQRDLIGAHVPCELSSSRYGAPIYDMPKGLSVLPIYLRGAMSPPPSSHERVAQFIAIEPQIDAILGLLDLAGQCVKELIWLAPGNYESWWSRAIATK